MLTTIKRNPKIAVFNAREIQQIVPQVPYILIRVFTPEAHPPPAAPDPPPRRDVLALQFCDYAKPLRANRDDQKRFTIVRQADFRPYLTFSRRDAGKILDFVAKWWGKVELILVHCDAGLSRSPAIAAALTRIFLGKDDEYWFQEHFPNHLVYAELLREAFHRGLVRSTVPPARDEGIVLSTGRS